MMIGSHFCQANNSKHAHLWENQTIRKEKNKALNLLSHNPILTRNVQYYCTMTDKRLRPWLTFVCPLQNSFWIICNDCINSHSLIILHLKAFHKVTTQFQRVVKHNNKLAIQKPGEELNTLFGTTTHNPVLQETLQFHPHWVLLHTSAVTSFYHLSHLILKIGCRWSRRAQQRGEEWQAKTQTHGSWGCNTTLSCILIIWICFKHISPDHSTVWHVWHYDDPFRKRVELNLRLVCLAIHFLWLFVRQGLRCKRGFFFSLSAFICEMLAPPLLSMEIKLDVLLPVQSQVSETLKWVTHWDMDSCKRIIEDR